MSDKKVIDLVTKPEKSKQEYKNDLLEIAEDFKKRVEKGNVSEFVIAAIDEDGELVLTTCARDLYGAIGMFSMAQHSLMMQQSFDFE